MQDGKIQIINCNEFTVWQQYLSLSSAILLS